MLRLRQVFPLTDGAPDLILGERYDVDSGNQVMCSEELTNRRTMDEYYVPLFRKLFRSHSPRILSLGCGVGADGKALCEAGSTRMASITACDRRCGNEESFQSAW